MSALDELRAQVEQIEKTMLGLRGLSNFELDAAEALMDGLDTGAFDRFRRLIEQRIEQRARRLAAEREAGHGRD
jgi:hypothetical protein